MNKRILSLTLLIVVLMSVLNPTISYAEETNRNEVRARLSEGGWFIVWGDLINEADYAEFIAAVALAVATENPGPIYEFFDYQLEAQLEKIQRTAPEIAQDALIDLFIRAFDSNGQVLQKGRLEVSADLATYKRWERVIYDEPRTYRCKQEFPWGGWTWSVCTTVERVEKTIPYPNNFQPYFRFRWVSGGSSSGSSSSSQNYDRVYFKNKCNRKIQTAINYKNLDGEWVTEGWWSLEPGESAFVAKTRNTVFYTYAESIAPRAERVFWSGDDLYRSIRGSQNTYGFRKKKITTQEWGTWTQNFTCRALQ